MTRSENTPRTDRLEALAALWARQTGRSVVVNRPTPVTVRPASVGSKA
jgi:hypothetical protein